MKIPNRNQGTLRFILLSVSILFSINVKANTFTDFDLVVTHDDNLTRSDYGPDKKSATAVELYADFGKFYDLDNNWSATALVFGQYSDNQDFSRLATLSYGLSASARKKLGLGAYSSSIQIALTFAVNDVDDKNRANNATDISLSWNKRLDDKWELSAGLAVDDSSADNSVYDSNGNTIFISADYTISDTLLLTFGLSQRSGDIISVTNPTTNPNESVWGYLSLASGGNNVTDTVFGTGLTAYRLDATTDILKVAISYALSDESSLNAGYEYQDSALAYGINYENNIFRINYIYSF